jgi:fluoride exporter
MNRMAILWVGLGGFIGANARYLLGGIVAEHYGTTFPLGTFVINVTGSFILGLFMAFAADRPWINPAWRLTFAIGFVGAYTTFSTFTYESIRLIQEKELLLATANVLGSVLLGGIAAFAGIVVGGLI